MTHPDTPFTASETHGAPLRILLIFVEFLEDDIRFSV
jgi:hypothetical protein